MATDDFTNLPEDPELAFVEFERRVRSNMWESIRENTSRSYDIDQKIYYTSKLIGFHDARGLVMLKISSMLRQSEDFDSIF